MKHSKRIKISLISGREKVKIIWLRLIIAVWREVRGRRRKAAINKRCMMYMKWKDRGRRSRR